VHGQLYKVVTGEEAEAEEIGEERSAAEEGAHCGDEAEVDEALAVNCDGEEFEDAHEEEEEEDMEEEEEEDVVEEEEAAALEGGEEAAAAAAAAAAEGLQPRRFDAGKEHSSSLPSRTQRVQGNLREQLA
jgi:hypothetical protein